MTTVHRHLRWHKDRGGTAYRTRRSFPAAPANATVLLAGPGSVSALDGGGRDDRLLGQLTERLVADGAQVLDCDLPPRDPKSPATEEDQRVRAERLGQLLSSSRHLATGPLSLVGFSLGGQSLLRLLEDGAPPRADRVVLVGTVVEEDVFLTSRIPAVELVYGGHDLVGYLADATDDKLPPAVFDPGMYADWSARHVIGTHTPAVRVHVLDGLGHTLHPCGTGPARDPLAALTSLVGAEW
ncbi:hypothetical protein ACQEWB_40120 [Streptomyces sp. CA-249302]|uniref:hypothetical protein n=1 Tax=Streptomyces sp. CA-249302 TaxID=3240058 RepID=UPI003D8B5131